MTIIKTAVGNLEEAFVQDGFDEHFNIISSDDNNRGKTIEIQSMLYALGNEPVFPASFEYKKYYHYIEFTENNTTYYLCRHNDDFIIKYDKVLMFLNGVSELKRYWDAHVFRLPRIIKNQISRIVDPVLFIQLFFVGQDKKDSSNIQQNGLYNKFDFYEMLYDMVGVSGLTASQEDIEKYKSEIKKLKNEEKILIRKNKILKSMDDPISYLSSINDSERFGNKVSEMDRLKSKIFELRKARNHAASRKLQWEMTLKELNSLNRTISTGTLKCMDCGSTNIYFNSSERGGYSFDVSSHEMRSEIIASINEKIITLSEEMEKLSQQINLYQDQLTEIMKEDDVDLESIVAYKRQYLDANDSEKRLIEIRKRISEYNDILIFCSKDYNDCSEKRRKLKDDIVLQINKYYKEIDPDSNLYFEDLFTKRYETISGSELTVFHLVKLFVLAKLLNHNYPIIVDSFRAEDLSTSKESKVFKLYEQLHNQIIFTTTLKKEEIGKYDNYPGINHIDYKDHLPSKMLTSEYVESFKEILGPLSISLT